MVGRGIPRLWIARAAIAGAGACAACVGAQPTDWLSFAPAGAVGASFWHPDANGHPINRVLEGGRGGTGAGGVVVPPDRARAKPQGSGDRGAMGDLLLSTALTGPTDSNGPFAGTEALPSSSLLGTTVAGARAGHFIPDARAPQSAPAARQVVQDAAPDAAAVPALSLRASEHLEQARKPPVPGRHLAAKKRRAR
jgi:hypothetical protein